MSKYLLVIITPFFYFTNLPFHYFLMALVISRFPFGGPATFSTSKPTDFQISFELTLCAIGCHNSAFV